MEDKCMWLCLPDSLVLQIFSYLSSKELLAAAQTCKPWLCISRDELLWKSLLYREWKIDRFLPLLPGQSSYFREYRRLKCRVPCHQVQILREHTDQVLHVSFSHNGKMFASCSKDGTIKVWKTGPPVTQKYNRAMKELFRWQYTQFSQFNATDTLLLVSGVHFGPNSTSGEIAVFNLKEDFALQARVLNKPYDIFGCWLNNSYLLSGNLHYLGHLSSCSALWLNKATQEVDSEQESVVMRLFKFLNINASTVRSITVANCRNLGRGEELRAKVQPAEKKDDEAKKALPPLPPPDGGSIASRSLQSSSESEVDTKASAYESDNEMTASESEVLKSVQVSSGSVDLLRGQNHYAEASVGESTRNSLTNEESQRHQRERVLCDRHSSQNAMHVSKSEPCLPSSDNSLSNRAQASSCTQSNKSNQPSGSKPIKRPCPKAAPQRSSPVKRDASVVSGSPPNTLRKSLRTDADVNKDLSQEMACVNDTASERANGGKSGHLEDRRDMPSTSGTSNGNPRGEGDTCYNRLWSRVRQAEIRRGVHNLDEELLKILIDGDPDYSAESQLDTPGSDSPMLSLSDSAQLEMAGMNPSNEFVGEMVNRRESNNDVQSAAVSSRCSSTDTVLSSPDTEQMSGASLTFAGESGSASDIIRAWGKQFTFGSTDSLDDEPAIHYPERRRGFSDPEVLARLQPTLPEYKIDDASNLSSSSMSDSQDFSHRTKVRRRKNAVKEETKHLIFTRGSQAYTPHQIGIKKIESTMSNTLRGPLGAQEGQRSRSEGGNNDQNDFDKVDYVIELNGHAIGMALSPDHRYLYVNCRCWPNDYVIGDPLTPPPIAQEIEIRVYDLVDMTEIKRFFGHKAFSPNDEFNFIFLDVCDMYVASGAEDRHGYIWDRYYGILLAKLPHRDVVNCVAFNPRDPEMLITASDDHSLKIWYSRLKSEQSQGAIC